jgi:hypothetical protein
MLLLALASIGTPAFAADDPPGRVGRVTEGQGQSWFYDTEAGEWVSLERNRPLTTGDRIAVDAAGRLELRIGSTAVRLAGGSELEISRLDDDRIDLFLHSGSAAVRVRSAEVAREVEMATVQGRFSPRGAAHFRVDHRDDSSVATAWSGELQFEGDDSTLTIPTGRSAELWREGAKNATHYAWGEPLRDDFADWAARANREDDRLAAPGYVSPEMTGWEDLAMAAGTRTPSTVRSGHRPPWWRAGLRIAMATGWSCSPGAGHGSTTRRGALRRSITGAGSSSAGTGAGHRATAWHGRSTHRPWWLGSVVVGKEARGRTSVGCRWRRANRITRTTPPVVAIGEPSTRRR